MTVRQDFINHLKLRGFSQCTVDNYVDNVAQLSAAATNHRTISITKISSNI